MCGECLSAEGDSAMVLFPQGQWVKEIGRGGIRMVEEKDGGIVCRICGCRSRKPWHRHHTQTQTSHPNPPICGLSPCMKQRTGSPTPHFFLLLPTPASNGFAHLTWSTVVVSKRRASVLTTPQRPSTDIPASKIPFRFALSFPIGPITE